MASSHPIVRQTKWLYVMLQFAILILLISVFILAEGHFNPRYKKVVSMP